MQKYFFALAIARYSLSTIDEPRPGRGQPRYLMSQIREIAFRRCAPSFLSMISLYANGFSGRSSQCIRLCLFIYYRHHFSILPPRLLLQPHIIAGRSLHFRTASAFRRCPPTRQCWPSTRPFRCRSMRQRRRPEYIRRFSPRFLALSLLPVTTAL